MRLLVFGSRSYRNVAAIERRLRDVLADCEARGEPLLIIDGDAPGVDRVAGSWADRLVGRAAIPVTRSRNPAHWESCSPNCQPGHRRRRDGGGTYCPTAGHRRNQRMIDKRQPDRAMGFVDKPIERSRGSRDMLERVKAAGIPWELHNGDGDLIDSSRRKAT